MTGSRRSRRTAQAALNQARTTLLASLPTLPIAAAPAPPAPVQSMAEAIQVAVSDSALVWDKKLGHRAMVVWFVPVVITLVWFLVVHRQFDKSFLALAIALGFMTAILVALWGINFSTGGFLQAIRGGDGRISTTYAQGALWTVLLAIAFILFVAQYGLGVIEKDTFTGGLSNFVPTYLLLLGGPFAAAAALQVDYGIRKDDGSIQKASDVGTQLKDVVSDDAGQANLNDSQFFVFNLVAAAAFVVMLSKTPTELPVLPDTLVALTSIAALSYVTTKAVSNQRPTITTIVAASVTGAGPASIEVGTLVDIRGANFVVAGTDTLEDLAQVRVKFGTVEVGVLAKRPDGTVSVSASSIYVNVPEFGVTTFPANVHVIVVTATGAQSEPYPLLVSA